jgi:hypothetical protein
MPLPNVSPTTPMRGVNAVDYQATRLALTLDKTNSKFAEFMADLAIRLESVVSPSLAVKSSVYETFGNNFVTRSGMAIMDSVMDATEGIFGTKEDEKEKERDPLLEAIGNQTKLLIELIDVVKGKVRLSPSLELDSEGEQFSEIVDVLKKILEKDCCDDTEMSGRLDKLIEKVQLIVDAIYGKRREDVDQVEQKHISTTKKTLVETEKRQLLALNNISKILVSHTKILEKMPSEKISTIEDVFESSTKKKVDDFIDVESRVVTETEVSESDSKNKKSGMLDSMAKVVTEIIRHIGAFGSAISKTIEVIKNAISSVFGGVKNGVGKVAKAIPKFLTGKIGKVATALGLGVGAYQSAKTIPDDIASLPTSSEHESNTIDVDVPRVEYKKVPPVTGKPKLPDVDPVTGKPTLDTKKLPDVDPVTGKPKLPDVDPVTGKPKLPDVDPVTGKPTLDTKKLPDVDVPRVEYKKVPPVTDTKKLPDVDRKSPNDFIDVESRVVTETDPRKKVPDVDPVTGKPTLDTKKLPDVDPVTGKPTLDTKKVPDVDVPKKSGGILSKIGKGVSKGMRFIPGIGLVVAGADAAYSAFDGVKDSGKIFGTESTSLSQDVSAGIGGVAESLSFGLLDKESIAQKTHNLYKSVTETTPNKQHEIERLEKKIEETKTETKVASSTSPVVVNNVTNNSQSFMSSRKYIENSDASYRRYIDSVFKTC